MLPRPSLTVLMLSTYCRRYVCKAWLQPTTRYVNNDLALAVATKVAVRSLTLDLHDKPADFPLNRHQGAQHGRVQRRSIRILLRKLREITTAIQHPIPSSVRRSQAPAANHHHHLNLIHRMQVRQEGSQMCPI